MKIEFDPNKNKKNIAERKLSFERAIDFEFHTAVIEQDVRNNYGETRYVAAGYLDKRLHILCFVKIKDGIRVISFRKANVKEVKKYGKSKTVD